MGRFARVEICKEGLLKLMMNLQELIKNLGIKEQRTSVRSERLVSALSLRANFLWTFIGNLIYGACQWGMIIVIAKLTSTEKLGHFALALAVTAPIIMFFNMQLRAVQATDVKEIFSFKEYLGHRLIALILALLTIFTVSLFYGRNAMLIILAIALAKAIESIGDIIYGLFQHRERMDRIARSMMIKGVSSLIVLGVVIWISRSIFLGAISLIASWLIVLVSYDLRNVRKFIFNNSFLFKPSFELGRIRKISIKALPLGIASILMSVNSNVPRYLIDSYMGPSQLGIFAALAYPVVAGSVVIMALGQAVTPRLAAFYFDQDINAFKSIILKMVLIAFIMALGGVAIVAWVGKPFLKIVYTTEYSKYVYEFIIIMVAGGISYFAFILGYALTAAQRFSIQAVSFAVNLIVTLIAGFMLIPIHGLQGAAYAMIIGSVSQILIESIKLVSLIKSRQAIINL